MATLYNTTGVVLSRRDRGEADRWYSVLTREHGKIELLARGGHKILAKLTPHLEMPAVIDFHVVNGRQFNTVAGTDRRVAYPGLYGDVSRLLLVRNALYLVDIATRQEEADPVLYSLVVDWLTTLDGTKVPVNSLSSDRAEFLLAGFALKLLAAIGSRPEVSRCLDCKATVVAGQYRWHALKGGVVCSPCVTRDNRQWFAARAISDDTLKLLRFGLAEPFESHLRPLLPVAALDEFHEAVEGLMISHFPVIPANSIRAACSL